MFIPFCISFLFIDGVSSHKLIPVNVEIRVSSINALGPRIGGRDVLYY